MAVIYPPRGQPRGRVSSTLLSSRITRTTVPDHKFINMFAVDMDEQKAPIYPSTTDLWHDSHSTSPEMSKRPTRTNAIPASAAETFKPGPCCKSRKGKAAMSPNLAGSSENDGHFVLRPSRPLDAVSAESLSPYSTHSQALKSVSDLALGALAIETSSVHSRSHTSGYSKTYSAYLKKAFSGSGIELDVQKQRFPAAKTPDANNTLITRRGSTRLSPNHYRPLINGVKESDAFAASQARIAMLEDWIHYHDFEERSTDACALVDWPQVQLFERKSAAHYAKHRAHMALQEHLVLRDQLPMPHDDNKTIDLKPFVDTKNGDSSIDNVMDIDNLDLKDAHFESDSRLPRTIAVLAKVYHRIHKLNLRLKDDSRQWKLFLGWLSADSTVARQPEAGQLERMGIRERILKEGACLIVESIDNLLSDYEAIRNSAEKLVFPSLATLKKRTFVKVPQSHWDIWKCSPQELRGLNLYPRVNDGDSDDLVAMKKRLPETFRQSLAFRASTLIELRIEVRDIAKRGQVEPEVDCNAAKDDDN